ncbi:MAG: hypothetical protein R6V38_12905 [Roseovarius gahaiensis]
MYRDNEEMHRYPRNGIDPENSSAAGSSSRVGLTALLIIVVLMSGLIVYTSLGGSPAQTPAPKVDTEAPDSITSSGGTKTQ